MNREKKYLFKNIGFLTLGQFGTKMLSFFLVPLYTYVLTTAEYGTYDLFNTTVALLVPILTMNIADAALRFPLDKNRDTKQIVSVALLYVLRSFLICFFGLLLNFVLVLSPTFKEFSGFILLLFIVHAINGVLVNLCRGLDHVKDVAASGVICSAVIIGLNILFLLPLRMGLSGYFLAHIIGSFAQCVYLACSIRIHKLFDFKAFNCSLSKEMKDYSKPLLINNISWWISSASDRYIVTLMCGIAENGIYSVGYKIPSILNIFQTIFNQAWTISAVKDYDQEDSKGFFRDMYNYYNFGMIIVCSGLIVIARLLASVLYAKDFYFAWRYVPFLLIATLFGSLSGYIGGIFAAVKDTKIFAKSSIIGAGINIVFNILLILIMGPLGAALSTAISYIVTWGLRVYHVKRYMFLKIKMRRDIISYVMLIIQGIVVVLIYNDLLMYSINIFITIIIAYIHRETISHIVHDLRKRGV